MKLALVLAILLIAVAVDSKAIEKKETTSLSDDQLELISKVMRRGSSKWYADMGKIYRGGARSFSSDDDEEDEDEDDDDDDKKKKIEPRSNEKRFWGLYGLGGMYGYGMGFGYPFGLWGKRDTLDVETHKQTMTDEQVTEKREAMMKDLFKVERKFYDLEKTDDVETKRDVEKRFWGMYGGLYGMGLGYGYPFGYGLWGKRDVEKKLESSVARQWEGDRFGVGNFGGNGVGYSGGGGGNNYNNNNANNGYSGESNFNNNNNGYGGNFNNNNG
jgi:hypothetical protein